MLFFFLDIYILQSRWCISAQHVQDLSAGSKALPLPEGSADYFCCCNVRRRLFLRKRNFPFWLLEGVISKWNKQARSARCHRTPGQLRVCARKPTDNPSTHLNRRCKMQFELMGSHVGTHPVSAAPCEAKELPDHCWLHTFFSPQQRSLRPRALPRCRRLPPAPLSLQPLPSLSPPAGTPDNSSCILVGRLSIRRCLPHWDSLLPFQHLVMTTKAERRKENTVTNAPSPNKFVSVQSLVKMLETPWPWR